MRSGLARRYAISIFIGGLFLFLLDRHLSLTLGEERMFRNWITTLVQNVSNKQHSVYRFHANKCKHKYGSITVVQMVGDANYMNSTVWNAVHSMRCYCKMRGYHLYQFNKSGVVQNEITTNNMIAANHAAQTCSNFPNYIKKRHCIVLHMLSYYDYVIHIDADTGVMNPQHCFEDFIDPDVDLHFLLRVHTNEIQAGHYILKNTTISKTFFSSYLAGRLDVINEQPKLQQKISETFLPPDLHRKCLVKKGEGYFKWVRCLVSSLHSLKTGTKRLLLYSRAHAFVRDGWANSYHWSAFDFMLHAMKHADDVFFTRRLCAEDCGNGTWFIPSRKERYVEPLSAMKKMWLEFDKRWMPNPKYALDVGIGHCWPNCPHTTV